MAKDIEQLTSEEKSAERLELLTVMKNRGIDIPEDDLTDDERSFVLAPAGKAIKKMDAMNESLQKGTPFNADDNLQSIEESEDTDIEIRKVLGEIGMETADVEDVIKNIDRLRNDKIGFKEAIANKNKLEALPFMGPLFKIVNMVSLLEDANTVNNGVVRRPTLRPSPGGIAGLEQIWSEREATPKEMQEALARVEDFILKFEERQSRGISIGGRIGEGVVELPGFIIEFILTGPLFKAASATAKTAAMKVLGRYAEKTTGRLAVRVAELGFGSLARTGVNVPRVMSGAVERMTTGVQITDDGAVIFADAEENPFTALSKSFLDLYIENISEVAGKDLIKGASFIGKGIGKRFPVIGKFTKELGEKWVANKAGRTINQFAKVSVTKTGFDGIIAEMGEERLGAILRAATGLDTFSEIVPSWEDLLVEAGVLSIFGVTSLAVNKVFRKPQPSAPVETEVREVLPGTELGGDVIAPSGIAVVEEVEGDIPLGLNRPEILDETLQDMSDSAFEKEFDIVEDKVLELEKHSDELDRELTRDEKLELAAVQDKISAFDNELFRRDVSRVDDIELVDRFLALNLNRDSDKLKAAILIDEISKDPDLKDRFQSLLEARAGESFDLNEIIGSQLKDAKELAIELRAEPTPIPKAIEGEVVSETGEAEGGIRADQIEQETGIKLIPGVARTVFNINKSIEERRQELIGKDREGLIINPERLKGEKVLNILATREAITGGKLAEPARIPKTIEAKVKTRTVETNSKAVEASTANANVEPAGDADAIRRSILRVEDVLGFWGSIGKKVQGAFRDISRRVAVNTGNTTQNIKVTLKGLSAKDKVTVSQLSDGAIDSEGQPPRLIERARQLKEQLDIMQNEAIKVGIRKGKLTGKAFPQILNDEGKAFVQEGETKGASSHKVFAWAQNQVTNGAFKTVDKAIAALQNYRKDRLRGTEGYFEGKRRVELDLDMREWNPEKVLPGIIEGGWENIEGARQWGITKDGNFETIRTDIERVRTEVGVDQANALEDYIKAQYGQSRASVASKRWSRRARAVQFIGKLAISPMTITKNMWDRYRVGFAHGTLGTNIRATIKFPPFLNKFMKTSQKIQDEMIRKGAVIGHGHLSEGFDATGGVSQFIGKPFALSERGNQTYIAIVKQLQLQADIKRLNEMGGEDGTVGKMYNRMLSVVGKSQTQTKNRVLTDMTNDQLADSLSKGEVSDDVMSEVLHRTVTDSAFPLTLASKRMWWGNRPWVQTMTQFKIWSADNMRFIYKDVLKYTIATGDPSRLGRFILGTWLAGEMYNISRDFLTGKDESLLSTLRDEDGRNVTEISKSIANSLVDGGIVGILYDLTYGITDWVLGPTVGSIESAVRIAVAVKNDPATTADGLKKFLLDDIPAAKQAQSVLDRIDRTFFDEENENLTANYAKWRQRSFEFQKEKGELTVAERTTGRALFGTPSRTPGPRTLSLEMLSRQVLIGDFDDGAQFIKGIYRDTPVNKVKDVLSAINSSGRSRSPMGNISSENLPLFLSQFSVENQAEIIKLQVKWMEGYTKATKIAITELQQEGFLDELKIKAEEFEAEIRPQIEKFQSTIDELRELLKDK